MDNPTIIEPRALTTIIEPRALTYELLLTAETPVSHHDPAIQDDSNRLLFNRQTQIVERSGSSALASPEQMAAIASCHPVPSDVAEICRDLSFPEFVGTVLIRVFLDIYNKGDGVGLFEGMARYERLETRIRSAAIPSPTLRSWWARLTTALKVPVHGEKWDTTLLDLLSLPMGTQQQVLRLLSTDFRSLVSVARLWHTTAKLESEEYAEAAGQMALIQPKVTLEFSDNVAALSNAKQIVEVPAVSGNSLRHQVVREPAFYHLCARLGLTPASPGQGPVPSGVEAIFYNGGNIESGAKQPSNVFKLARQARELYPSLDLLGGVTDSFDVGESQLWLAGWLVCAENYAALGEAGQLLANARLSAFDMFDDVTLTRQAGLAGEGQMIYTFETLAAGTQILVRMRLHPFTPVLTRGALEAAITWFLEHDATIGGQAARGFGHVRGEWLQRPDAGDALEQYEAYLEANREQLVDGLVSGTLGTPNQILS